MQALLIKTYIIWLIIIILMMSGCGKEDAYEKFIYTPKMVSEQIDKLEAYYKKDFSLLRDVKFYKYNQEELDKRCGSSSVACVYAEYMSIVIVEHASENCEVITHELLHFVLRMEEKLIDEDHVHPIWLEYVNLFCEGKSFYDR